jgi:hypothetical protein
MRVGILLVLMLAGPALAAEPAPVVVAQPPTAAGQVEAVAAELSRVRPEVDAWVARVSQGAPEDLGVLRAQLAARLEGPRGRLRALTPFAGDAGLRDAAVTLIDDTRAALERALAGMGERLAKPVFVSADLDACEALIDAFLQQARGIDRAFADAQQAFARRHGLQLVLDPVAPVSVVAPFVAPGVVPAGAHLGAAPRTALAMRYHNEVVDAYNRGLGAMSSFFAVAGAADGDVERARLAAVDALAAAQTMGEGLGAWQGDDAFRAATLEGLDRMRAALVGPGAEYARLRAQTSVSPSQAAQMAALVDALNQAPQEATAAWGTAQAAFQARWAFAPYLAWVATQDR